MLRGQGTKEGEMEGGTEGVVGLQKETSLLSIRMLSLAYDNCTTHGVFDGESMLSIRSLW